MATLEPRTKTIKVNGSKEGQFLAGLVELANESGLCAQSIVDCLQAFGNAVQETATAGYSGQYLISAKIEY